MLAEADPLLETESMISPFSGSVEPLPLKKSGARMNFPSTGVSNVVFPISEGLSFLKLFGGGGTELLFKFEMSGGGGGGGGIVVLNDSCRDSRVCAISAFVVVSVSGNDAFTRSGPSKFPLNVTTGELSSNRSSRLSYCSQSLKPILCMVTSLYSKLAVPAGSSTLAVQMFPSVHFKRNPTSGSHAPKTAASPTTPT